jgi:hypothetical protein
MIRVLGFWSTLRIVYVRVSTAAMRVVITPRFM